MISNFHWCHLQRFYIQYKKLELIYNLAFLFSFLFFLVLLLQPVFIPRIYIYIYIYIYICFLTPFLARVVFENFLQGGIWNFILIVTMFIILIVIPILSITFRFKFLKVIKALSWLDLEWETKDTLSNLFFHEFILIIIYYIKIRFVFAVKIVFCNLMFLLEIKFLMFLNRFNVLILKIIF